MQAHLKAALRAGRVMTKGRLSVGGPRATFAATWDAPRRLLVVRSEQGLVLEVRLREVLASAAEEGCSWTVAPGHVAATLLGEAIACEGHLSRLGAFFENEAEAEDEAPFDGAVLRLDACDQERLSHFYVELTFFA